jgi:DNA polymerase I-like protein with 3'-5' exonuclease and polymerase domains
MKIAVVEKAKMGHADPYREYFKFEYDRFQLVTSNKSKILKRDITLDFSELDDYDLVVLIGAEPSKHVADCRNVTKYAGHVVKDKYIPMLNPVAVKFNPGIKDTLEGALKKLHDHIDGSYKEVLGDYRGITCAKEAKSWITKALHKHTCPNLAVDTEDSSFYPREGYVLGICLSLEPMTGVYISSDCIDDEVEHLLQELFNKKVCVFHNAKFDMKWLQYHFNFKFPVWHDTMIMHYLLNENEAHDLKSLAMKYTTMGDYDFELEQFKKEYMKIHKIKVADFSYELIPFDIMYKYAAGDADATIRLFNKFSPIIFNSFNWLYENIMKRGTQFLMEIEETGVPFDKEYLDKANKIFEQEIFDLKQELYKFPEIHEMEKEYGQVFNPGSPAQLATLFFDKLGLSVIKKTPTGAPSTDKEVLEKLAELHEIPNIVSQIRSKIKLRSTYIIKVLNGIDLDGRLRAGFHLHTVTSGRLSSSGKLNMQQLPRDDKTVKNCIRAMEDYVIFSQDLQTAEMYYAGALSNDQNLAKVFKSKTGDFHSSIAKMTFNIAAPVEEIKIKFGDLRQAAKAISFGILYGAGAAKVASEAGISFSEAKTIIRKYFEQFAQLDKWIRRTQDEINSNGYIYSHFGRKRRVPNVFSVDDYEQGHALRSAMNFTVQSVASDINLMAAMDVHDEFKKGHVRAEIFALVHDSIIGQCHKDDIEKVQKILKVQTQKDRGVSIPGAPIGVDFGYGESYAKAG